MPEAVERSSASLTKIMHATSSLNTVALALLGDRVEENVLRSNTVARESAT